MQVFVVTHTIVRTGRNDDDKRIGVFSTEDLAKKAVAQVKDLPGFRDPRGFFTIEAHQLDVDDFSLSSDKYRMV